MASDRELGMFRDISRRDFVNGSAVALGALGTPSLARAAAKAVAGGGVETSYPPAKTGMRGSHPGAFENAHALRDGTLDIHSAFDTGETYDCVVVGAGMSGLAAAHFFSKNVGPGASILIIDNHDDFGGVAKRNEFTVNGRKLVINGGTLNIESPQRYNQWARSVLDDIGVDLPRYEAANKTNKELYRSLGLGSAHFFDKETWQRDMLLAAGGEGGRGGRTMSPDFVNATPLSAKAKADMLRLLAPDQPDYLTGMSITDKKALLAKTSLQDYYLKIVKVDPQVLWFYSRYGEGNHCVGADANPALLAWMSGLPGFSGLGLGAVPDGLFENLPGGQHGKQKEGGKSVHFPGRAMRCSPACWSPASSPMPSPRARRRKWARRWSTMASWTAMESLSASASTAPSSMSAMTATRRRPARRSSPTSPAASSSRVRAKSVVMACWNMFIPLSHSGHAGGAEGSARLWRYGSARLHQCRGAQLEGVGEAKGQQYHGAVHVPLVGRADRGGGDRRPDVPQTPDEPMLLHLGKVMSVPGLPKRDQHRAGRAQLLGLSIRGFRAQHARSARQDALRRRLRSGARHRRDHRLPLAPMATLIPITASMILSNGATPRPTTGLAYVHASLGVLSRSPTPTPRPVLTRTRRFSKRIARSRKRSSCGPIRSLGGHNPRSGRSRFQTQAPSRGCVDIFE